MAANTRPKEIINAPCWRPDTDTEPASVKDADFASPSMVDVDVPDRTADTARSLPVAAEVPPADAKADLEPEADSEFDSDAVREIDMPFSVLTYASVAVDVFAKSPCAAATAVADPNARAFVDNAPAIDADDEAAAPGDVAVCV